MKTTYNLNKFCKAADNDILFEETSNAVTLCNKHGIIALCILKDLRKPCTILDQLRAKSKVKVAEVAGLTDKIRRFIHNEGDALNVCDTGIRLPVADRLKTRCAALRIAEGCDFKYVNEIYMDVFEPELLYTTKDVYSPIVALCLGCYGIVFPVKVDKEQLPTAHINALAASLL